MSFITFLLFASLTKFIFKLKSSFNNLPINQTSQLAFLFYFQVSYPVIIIVILSHDYDYFYYNLNYYFEVFVQLLIVELNLIY